MKPDFWKKFGIPLHRKIAEIAMGIREPDWEWLLQKNWLI